MNTRKLQSFLGLGLVVLFAGMATFLTGVEAYGQEQYDDVIHVFQPRPVLQKGRFDFAPRFGGSINDSMYQSYKVGGNLNVHFTERLYLGALFDWYRFGNAIGGPSESFKGLRNETQTAADAPVINWAGGLELGYAPLAGKFTLFNSYIFFYDISLSAGAAWVESASLSLPAASTGIGATWSITNRIFFNRWIALNVELRDMMFYANMRGMPEVLSHVLTASVGFSFYFPSTFEYKYDHIQLLD